MCGIVAVAVREGIGAYSHGANAAALTKLIVANNNLWAATVNVTKASILMQYLRIFSGRTTRGLCYFLLALLPPAACWAVFGGTFRCHPVAKLWNPHLTGECFSAQMYWQSVAGIDIGLDFLILLLPMPAISALHLPRKQKASMMLVFLLGFFVCAVSVTRLVLVTVTSNRGNFVASGVWAIIWSVVEANVGIICASLLALKPLIGKLFPRFTQEREVPSHCMRLPAIQASDDTTLVKPRAGSGPLLSTQTDSVVEGTQKHSSISSGWSDRRRSSWLPVPVAAGNGASEPSSTSPDTAVGGAVTPSIADMLQVDSRHDAVV